MNARKTRENKYGDIVSSSMAFWEYHNILVYSCVGYTRFLHSSKSKLLNLAISRACASLSSSLRCLSQASIHVFLHASQSSRCRGLLATESPVPRRLRNNNHIHITNKETHRLDPPRKQHTNLHLHSGIRYIKQRVIYVIDRLEQETFRQWSSIIQ